MIWPGTQAKAQTVARHLCSLSSSKHTPSTHTHTHLFQLYIIYITPCKVLQFLQRQLLPYFCQVHMWHCILAHYTTTSLTHHDGPHDTWYCANALSGHSLQELQGELQIKTTDKTCMRQYTAHFKDPSMKLQVAVPCSTVSNYGTKKRYKGIENM